MWADRNIGLIVIGIGFVLSYFVMVTQWGLLQTARELMTRADPEASARQKVEEFKQDWRAAAAPPAYLPDGRETSAPLGPVSGRLGDHRSHAPHRRHAQTGAGRPQRKRADLRRGAVSVGQDEPDLRARTALGTAGQIRVSVQVRLRHHPVIGSRVAALFAGGFMEFRVARRRSDRPVHPGGAAFIWRF